MYKFDRIARTILLLSAGVLVVACYLEFHAADRAVQSAKKAGCSAEAAAEIRRDILGLT